MQGACAILCGVGMLLNMIIFKTEDRKEGRTSYHSSRRTVWPHFVVFHYLFILKKGKVCTGWQQGLSIPGQNIAYTCYKLTLCFSHWTAFPSYDKHIWLKYVEHLGCNKSAIAFYCHFLELQETCAEERLKNGGCLPFLNAEPPPSSWLALFQKISLPSHVTQVVCKSWFYFQYIFFIKTPKSFLVKVLSGKSPFVLTFTFQFGAHICLQEVCFAAPVDDGAGRTWLLVATILFFSESPIEGSSFPCHWWHNIEGCVFNITQPTQSIFKS